MRNAENRTQETDVLLREIARVQAAFHLLPRNVFVIADNAPVIARELGLPRAAVVDILSSPNPPLYPDVPHVFQRISSVGSFPVVWTQGHVDEDIQLESKLPESERSFQMIKILRSGLHTHLLPFEKSLSDLGIPVVFGGFDKCAPERVLPVLETARRNGAERVVAVDDLDSNLINLGRLCTEMDMIYTPVLIDRCLNSKRTGAIRTFDELSIDPDALYLLDLDRTQIDTDSMKYELFTRLAELCQSLSR